MTKATVTSSTLLSPYAAAKRVNEALQAEGIKQIPAQMMYNYTTARLRSDKKPLLPVELDEQGRVFITVADVDAWAEKYIAKKTAPVTEAVEA